MALAREKGQEIKENWLLLKRVYHYELKEYEKVAEVLNTLIARFPKREYWNQLSAVYGELGDNKRQLAVLELADMQGYLDRSQDLRNLSQLYMMNGDPLRGAQTLEKAMSDGIVETNLANLRLLAQAWGAAREDEKALPVLERAAGLAPDGKLDLRIAYSYINIDEYDKAAAAAAVPDELALLSAPIGNRSMVEDRIEVYRRAGVDALRIAPTGRTLTEQIDHLEMVADLLATDPTPSD